MIGTPYIPETITVHLGRPDADAENVTVSFPDYIKNVASSEIYPTWPENAIRANIYAQISFALNRVYTEWYRSRGYDFDITNSTAFDQSYVKGRDIFENISRIVDEIFDEYIRRQGNIEPLFAAFCDGEEVQCDGLSQWGSVSLAEQGYVPYNILTYYYGDDIDIVMDAPIQNITESYSGVALRLGSSGGDVRELQIKLNRISKDYPLIPKISDPDGRFGVETEEAVRQFQKTFNLEQDGIVGKATWYRIQYIFAAVTRLAELDSEGLRIADIPKQFVTDIREGDSGDEVIAPQYYLSFISAYNSAIPRVAVDGVFGSATRQAVEAFQREYGLDVTGIIDKTTWDRLTEVYLGIIGENPPQYLAQEYVPYPGRTLKEGDSGEAVRLIQERLLYLSGAYPNIPAIDVSGYFGPETEEAVLGFQREFGLPQKGIVGPVSWNEIERVYLSTINGEQKTEGQNPGYVVGGE